MNISDIARRFALVQTDRIRGVISLRHHPSTTNLSLSTPLRHVRE